MAYCTWQDVQKKMKLKIFTANSKPNTDEITTFCDEITEEMDIRFQAAGVILPVIDAGKLVYLRNIAVDGVIAEIYASIIQDQTTADAYYKRFEASMKRIEENPSILNSATTIIQGPGYKSDNDTRIFVSGETQW